MYDFREVDFKLKRFIGFFEIRIMYDVLIIYILYSVGKEYLNNLFWFYILLFELLD